MKLNKALYGCMQLALLWYRTFKNKLQNLGFKLNKYDPCVANKNIEGSQCTVVWYVDDSKVSHKSEEVVTLVTKRLEEEFGIMSTTRGRKHNFVGIDISFEQDGTVKIIMKNYLRKSIKSFGEIFNGGAATPAKQDLFEVNHESTLLNDNKREFFHHIVAKLLFVAKRARPDIDLAISFLCSRVDKSTEQDWGKLRRLLHYLNGTIDLEWNMSMNGTGGMETWVDASYGVHTDTRGHTGGVISLGKGIVHHKTAKQRINTKSSTESKLVGASDYLPHTVWLGRFLQEQGYKINQNIYYQDNESAIKLETNGIRSKGEKSRHINIRYFFIKDILQKEGIELRHCKTERMVGDYFTKPVQGGLLKKTKGSNYGYHNVPN